MENQTRFDLNAAVENWRQELAAQPPLAPDNRRELETHLRDALAELKARGLNDEESFWLARRRVGQPQNLGEEFGKIDLAIAWRERLFWICLAFFLSSILANVTSGLAIAVSLAGARGPMTMNWVRQSLQLFLWLISSAIPLLLVVSLAKGRLTWLFLKLRPILENQQRLAIAATAGVFLSVVIRWLGTDLFYSRMNIHNNSAIVQMINPLVYQLIAGIVLVWLLPVRPSKIAQSS
jgi:hypothetical protein